jgi:hypothetical protein
MELIWWSVRSAKTYEQALRSFLIADMGSPSDTTLRIAGMDTGNYTYIVLLLSRYAAHGDPSDSAELSCLVNTIPPENIQITAK